MWIGALAVMTLALAAALIVVRPGPAAPEMRVEITTPPTAVQLSMALSPDGGSLAYVGDAEGVPRLCLRSLTSGVARVVPGTDGADAPFWSPDSRSVGFFAGAKLRRIDVNGGSAQTLATVTGGQGGTWNSDGVILYAALGRPIQRVPATGGEPVALSRLAQQGSDFTPHFLPGGRQFLYYVRGTPEIRGTYVGQLGDPLEPRRLLESDSGAVFSPQGYLLFVRHGTLFAQAFDSARLQLSGNPVPVVEQASSRGQPAVVSVSSVGTIAYRPLEAPPSRQLVWVDRSGKDVRPVGAIAGSAPSLSLDDRRVAFYRGVEGNVDVWLLDAIRGVASRFTTDAADDVFPVWSPDGGRLVFSSNRSGVHQLYQKSVGGGSEASLLATAQPATATDWSHDGRFLLFSEQDRKQGFDIWALPMAGGGKPFPVVQTEFEEQYGQFSPDGRWIAYQSDESGRTEVYVQPFPGPGSKLTVSTNGGSQVRWRRDGKELFYIALDGRLMAVPVTSASGGQLDIGAPAVLFAPKIGSAVQQGDYRYQYMVTADGQRFLVNTVSDAPSLPITLILNWKPRP
jgi:Tol biopolymer transport system component